MSGQCLISKPICPAIHLIIQTLLSSAFNSTVQALISDLHPVYWLRLHCSSYHCVNYGFRVALAPTNYTDHNDSAAVHLLVAFYALSCVLSHNVPCYCIDIIIIVGCKIIGVRAVGVNVQSIFILIRHFDWRYKTFIRSISPLPIFAKASMHKGGGGGGGGFLIVEFYDIMNLACYMCPLIYHQIFITR